VGAERGLVEQKDRRSKFYERPRSKFVATFLGSPQRILVDGKLASETVGGSGRRRIVAPVTDEDSLATSLVEGSLRPRSGVRPHDLVPSNGAAACHAQRRNREALGFEALRTDGCAASGSGSSRASKRRRRRVKGRRACRPAVDPGTFISSIRRRAALSTQREHEVADSRGGG